MFFDVNIFETKNTWLLFTFNITILSLNSISGAVGVLCYGVMQFISLIIVKVCNEMFLISLKLNWLD